MPAEVAHQVGHGVALGEPPLSVDLRELVDVAANVDDL